MSINSKKVTDLRPEITSSIPWSEWSDAELNVEKWDAPKNGSDGCFSDDEPRMMPPSLEPHEWRRASALKNLSGNLVLFTPRNEYPDFVKNNKHILHSEFVRWFISTLVNLQYAGRNGLRVEESPNFIWLGESRPWQGWMYIYSLNKGGKSASQQQQRQQPVINLNGYESCNPGKYVVRLFFMGFWRRFVVDDMIPLDIYGTPILPRTENDFEIWPILLAKALMKLAALTWNDQREIRDFYPVSCFTGWICLPQITKSLSANEKWEVLISYLTDEENIRDISEKKVLLCANVIDTRDLTEDTIPGITPCWSHFVYFDKARGISGNKDQSIPPPEVRWKLHRWVKWAMRHGLTEGEDFPMSGIRSLKLVSSLKEYGKKESLDEDGREPITKLEDIGVWVEFKKLAPYIEEILMFYKPSDFEYHARVSDTLSTTVELSPGSVSAGGVRGKPQPAGGRESKKAMPATSSNVVGVPPFVSSFKWQRDVPNRRNDPLYMLIDSIETKFVLIDFSCMPRPRPAPLNATENRNINGFVGSYLLVERHNFFERSNDDDPVALIRTLSSGATVFQIEPGRHLYRILFREENSYFIRIISDTIFYLGNRLRMQNLMSSESERLEVIAKGISNAVSSAFQEFGRPGYANEVRALHRSYMPRDEDRINSGINKKYIKSIHQIFVEELLKLVNETLPTSADSSTACHALRVFFLDPTIGVNSVEYKEQLPDVSSRYLESSKVYQVGEERAAVKIQSFIRMAVIKMYKKAHLPSHIKYAEVTSGLRKIVELFDFTKRDSIAHLLIRRIICRVSSNGYQTLYPCKRDFHHVLNVEELQGVARNIQPGQWVPVTRVVLNLPSQVSKVHAAFDLATGLPRQILRVVNNETLREVTRFVNSPATVHFPHVECGYTVIGYGWSDAQKFKELPWLLRVTTIRGQPKFRNRMVVPSLALQELADCYIPNVSNIIGKWIVKVVADSLLTLRLSTSYSEVETVLKVFDGEENVLCEASGGSIIILPVVRLPFFGNLDGIQSQINSRTQLEEAETARARNRSKLFTLDYMNKDMDYAAKEYYIRAYVVNDSWPLTSAEWNTIMEIKSKGTVYDPHQGKTSTVSILRRGMRNKIGRSSQDHIGDGDARPSWKLQVLTDAGTRIQVEQDRRRELEIGELKKTWEEAEVGRLQRGRTAREAFLEEGWATWTRSSTANSGSETRESAESVSVPSDQTMETRTLKPPTTNLSRDFPPWNVIASVFKEDEEDAEEECWVKTEADEEMLRNQRAINVFDFEQMQATFVDESEDMLRDEQRRYSEYFDSFMKKEIKWKSRSEAAYELRSAYAAEVKATISARQGNKNGKDTITTKNKKKDEKKEKKDKKMTKGK